MFFFIRENLHHKIINFCQYMYNVILTDFNEVNDQIDDDNYVVKDKSTYYKDTNKNLTYI